MATRRRRRARSPDPYEVDGDIGAEMRADGGDLDFEAGLPSTASGERRTVSKRDARRTYDPEGDLGEAHARGAAGRRYRDEIDFEAGLPRVNLEKTAPSPVQEPTPAPEPPPPPPKVEALPPAPQGPRKADVEAKLSKQETTEVQTLVFSKESFTRARAVSWAKEHDFRSDKVDETSTSFRLRQREPDAFQEGSFRIISLTTGVQAVVGRPKQKSGDKAKKRDGLSYEEFRKHAGPVPEILTWDAVRKEALVVDEAGAVLSGLPESLERDVPPRFRYWQCETREDALRVREALVEAALFTPETVREVNGELRRADAEVVVKLYLPPAYDDSEPPEVPTAARPVEKAASLLEAGSRVTVFDEAVVEVLGIETIMGKVRDLETPWLIGARDSAEVRKAIGGPAFRLLSRDDLVFATSANLRADAAVEWVVRTREDEVLKHAFREGREIRLLKAAGEERIVFGVVLEPDEVDAQGDTIDAETIKVAAHKFMEDFGNLGLQHKEIVNGKLKLLESFLAPVGFKVDGEQVKKGTWLMKERVVDDALWAAVKKGEFTGFSIGGSAIRKPAR